MSRKGIKKELSFEYDEVKSCSNKAKHGIDFVAAQAIWSDMHLLEQAVVTTAEQRYVVTGNENSRIWSAVITYRSGKVRIISVQRAGKTEVALYEYQKEISRYIEKSVTAKEFDRIFDEGKEDVVQYLDLSSMRHPNKEAKRVNVDFPLWMVTGLDAVAAHFGVT